MTRFPSQLRPQLSRFARFTGLAYLANLGRARLARMARSIRMLPHQLIHQLTQLPRQLVHHSLHVVAIAALILSMGGTWMLAKDANAAPGQKPAVVTASSSAVTSTKQAPSQAPLSDDDLVRPRPAKKDVTGKINLNTATEDQLMLLPSVGPSKAERVVTWRKKSGGFKRTADLRRVKGFGYKTFKRLEPFLDIKGDTTLAPRR